ncbi:MAG: M16 family metallopeptidase [Mycobacteriales bacterium]
MSARGKSGVAAGARPPLGPPPRIAVPRVAERTLDNGLRVAAVRETSVPLVELRLRLPFAGTGRRHLARTHLLAETAFSGTEQHDARGLAAAVQALGGGLDVGADSDRLGFSGSALAENLGGLLGLLAEVVTGATYPAGEVAGERDRLVEELVIARTVPSTLAAEALSRRVFGSHPYGFGLPTAAEVRAVSPAALRTLHRSRVSPEGALLVVVGDVPAGRALDLAERALGGWSGDGRRRVTLPPPPAFTPGGVALVDRPGSVQSSIRYAGHGPRRDDPSYAALVAANTVFAGYFSSRLIANIREDKGFTYGAHSHLDHADLATLLAIDTDVATEVTARSLVEVAYEQARMVTAPVTQDELDAARRYLVGTLALSTSSQAGLASTLARLLDAGLAASYLRDHPAALAKVTVDAAYEAAARWLAPSAMACVVVGDAAIVGDPMRTLAPVTPMAVD